MSIVICRPLLAKHIFIYKFHNHNTMIRFSQEADFSWKLNYPGLADINNKSSELITKHLKSYDILVVDFLYENYIKQFKGAILNEEIGFNSPLQVSAFLNRIFCNIEQKFLVLVLTSDEDIIKWHYHLIAHGGFKVQIIGPTTCPADFDQEHGLVLLLRFQEIKLAEALMEYPFFSVIIDHFDEIATKLIVKKLQGEFNIGISSRNFYSRPNQKLLWTMLNWSNPGLFGKLGDFYNDDSENFSNLRDNYHFWWFSLTWEYENFQRPSELENLEYTKKLSSWAAANRLSQNIKKQERSQKLRSLRHLKPSCDENEKLGQEKGTNKIECEINVVAESENHDSTIKNEDDHNSKNNCIPVVRQKIMREIMTDSIELHCNSLPGSSQKDSHEELSDIILLKDDIILSIINEDETPEAHKGVDHESQLADKKKELLSDIFDDVKSPNNEPNSEDSDFLLSLI